MIRTEGFATSLPDFNQPILQIRSSWNKSSDCMLVQSLCTRGVTTTHLDSHLLCCSGRNDKQNVNRVRLLWIGLSGPNRIMPFSSAAVKPIQIRAPSILIQILLRRVMSSRVGSSQVLMESTQAGQSFSIPLESSAHLLQQQPVRISSIGSFLIERNANLSSAF